MSRFKSNLRCCRRFCDGEKPWQWSRVQIRLICHFLGQPFHKNNLLSYVSQCPLKRPRLLWTYSFYEHGNSIMKLHRRVRLCITWSTDQTTIITMIESKWNNRLTSLIAANRERIILASQDISQLQWRVRY